MKHTLHIQLRANEGAIIRALGLVERRGFRIEQVTVGEAQGDGHPVRLTVRGDRPIDLLKRQLERVYDIIWVEIEAAGQSAPDRTQGVGMRPVTRRN